MSQIHKAFTENDPFPKLSFRKEAHFDLPYRILSSINSNSVTFLK